MTKEALSAAVAAKLDVTKSFGEDAVNAVLDSITEALAEKENVVLIGFCLLYTSPSPRDTR